MSDVNKRHHLVLLFTDLCSSTRIAAQMEPEEYAELLANLRALVSTTIARHGGEVVRIDGDGALCIFGFPVPHEDDGRRAVEAAIDLHEAIDTISHTGGYAAATKDIPIQLHSGIHAGIVLLRSGDIIRGRYEVLGDATNTAAHLCESAEANQILVTPGTLGSDRHFFVASVSEVDIGGRNEPLTTLSIEGRAETPHRFAARMTERKTPFVGRDREQIDLAKWLEGSDLGAMLVYGDAGIGKSRLVRRFAAHARASGWQVARGYCESYLGAAPLQPVMHVVGEIGGSPLTMFEGGNGRYAGELAIANIIAAASRAPLLIVIDDWQWADDASRVILGELLDGVARLSGHGRLKLLFVSRNADLGFLGQTASMQLRPLDPGASSAVIDALLLLAEPGTKARIEAASGGSPLLIEELCHASLRANQDPLGDRLAYSREAWFDIAVQARFNQLTTLQAEVLRRAAVIGNYIPSWLLRAICREASDDAVIGQLQEADFLLTNGRLDQFHFKHGLTRDAIYAGLSLAQRREIHREILLALQEYVRDASAPPLFDLLAYHSAEAGMADQALPYAMKAGDAALAAGALDRAQGHYRKAIEFAEAMPDSDMRIFALWTLLNKFGLASIIDPSAEQLGLLRRLEALLVASKHKEGEIRSAYWQGAIEYGLGQGKASIAHLKQALSLAQRYDNARYMVQIRGKLALSSFAAGKYAEAEDMLRHSVAEAGDIIDNQSQSYALCCLGFLLADQGHFEESARIYERARAANVEEEKGTIAAQTTQQSAVSSWRGEWQKAIDQARECQVNSQITRARYHMIMAIALEAYPTWQLKRDPKALETLQYCADWFSTPGNSRQRTSLVYGWLVDILTGTGNRTLARRYAIEVVQRVRHGGDRLGEAMAWRGLARMEGESGQHMRAAHYLALAQKSAEARNSPRERAHNRLCAAHLMVLRGEASGEGEAEAAAEELMNLGLPQFAEEAQLLVAASH